MIARTSLLRCRRNHGEDPVNEAANNHFGFCKKLKYTILKCFLLLFTQLLRWQDDVICGVFSCIVYKVISECK